MPVTNQALGIILHRIIGLFITGLFHVFVFVSVWLDELAISKVHKRTKGGGGQKIPRSRERYL